MGAALGLGGRSPMVPARTPTCSRSLYADAGLRLTRIVATPARVSVIEGRLHERERRRCGQASVDFPYSFPYHDSMRATVTSKGQITIPLPIRRKLKLHKGTILEFDERADHLKATKCADAARMRSVIGIARKELAGKSVAQWVEVLRGPVDLPRRRR